MMVRPFISCQFCQQQIGSDKHEAHELICVHNPRAPKRIKVFGKTYIRKFDLPKPHGETPLLISVVLLQHSQEVMLREDAFFLARQGLLSKTRHSNYFMLKVKITSDEMDEVWKHIEKAKAYGARL